MKAAGHVADHTTYLSRKHVVARCITTGPHMRHPMVEKWRVCKSHGYIRGESLGPNER